MWKRSCTIESSCLIALDHLNLIPQMSFLFSTVLVPKAVRQDLFKRRTTKDRIQLIFDDYKFFQRCDHYDQGTVDFLLAERTRRGSQDRGEVEAVVQAAQLGAAVIVDDQWGRELAELDDLEFHGTVWLLQQFHELQLIHTPTLRECFLELRERGIRLPWAIVNTLLVEIGESPIGVL